MKNYLKVEAVIMLNFQFLEIVFLDCYAIKGDFALLNSWQELISLYRFQEQEVHHHYSLLHLLRYFADVFGS